MLNKSGIVAIGAAAGDRMEAFGVIIFAMIMTIYFHQMESWGSTIEISKQWLYAVTLFAGSVSILTCGKRGIEIVYICCMVALVFVIYLYKNSGSKRMVLMLFFAFIVSFPNLASDFNRTLGTAYDSIGGAPHKEEIISLIRKDNQAEGSLLYDFASGLDYSGADRIGRMIKTLRLSYENNFIGTGFQGVQYKYGYLPDSGLQLLLETGLAGALSLLLFLYYLLAGVAKIPYITNRFAIVHISLAVGTLAMLCIFSNQLYMPRFMMIFAFYVSLSVLYGKFLKFR
jgi:hypothetical protein